MGCCCSAPDLEEMNSCAEDVKEIKKRCEDLIAVVEVAIALKILVKAHHRESTENIDDTFEKVMNDKTDYLKLSEQYAHLKDGSTELLKQLAELPGVSPGKNFAAGVKKINTDLSSAFESKLRPPIASEIESEMSFVPGFCVDGLIDDAIEAGVKKIVAKIIKAKVKSEIEETKPSGYGATAVSEGALPPAATSSSGAHHEEKEDTEPLHTPAEHEK